VCPEHRGFAMLEESEKVVAAIDKAAKKLLHTMVST
jgi:hypothetical protein